MKTTELNIPIGKQIILKGNLSIPEEPNGLVIFSHGSGSSRFSSRNRHVAEILNKQGIATLLIDLLTEEEDSVYKNRFNINLLTERLIAVTNYTSVLSDLRDLPIGFFGASTGAASALKAAGSIKNIQAIVSRGGRPDLAGNSLKKVTAPTLLIIGSLDTDVISLNEEAYHQLTCEKDWKIVEGATHLFEEPGKLDIVANYAVDWFTKHLVLNPSIK